MATPADWIKVLLTPEEISRAEKTGRLRHDRDAAKGYRVRGFGNVETHTLGCLGELAVAKYENDDEGLTTTWEADKRRGYDVAGWQVRTRQHATYGLNLHTGDTGRFLLALGHARPVIWLAGWLHAHEGFPLGTRREDGTGDTVWWLVDQTHLKPLPEQNGFSRHAADSADGIVLVDPETWFWCDNCNSTHPIRLHASCRQGLLVERSRRIRSTLYPPT